MHQRSLSSLFVITLMVACGKSEHTTKGGSAGHAGSSSGASGASGRGGTSGGAGTSSAAGGASASGGRAGSGGSIASGGNAAIGGAGASAASGGSAAGESGSGADAGEAGAGTSLGGSGDGGTGNTPSGDVHGKIIDFWGHPVPGAPVAIGGVRAVTDSSGTFVIPDVAAEYDVSFIVHWDEPTSTYGWVYQGLTRRDPTLQVIRALNDNTVGIELHPVAASAPFTDDFSWLLGFGSPNGKGNSTSDENGIIAMPSWQGPDSNEWTLHSLYLVRTSGLPTSYRAYGASAIPVTSGDPTQYPPNIDLTAQTLDTGNVSGEVTFDTGVGATNSVFVRFTSGAQLPLVDAVDTGSSTPDYSYLVPSLPNGSITVAAAERHDDGAYAVAHRDGLAPGASNIDLTVPVPGVPATPSYGTENVDDSTNFSFSGGDSDVHAYLVHIEDENFYDGMFIVTAKKQFTLGALPIVDGEFQLRSGQAHQWWVETHGKPANVDAMAAPGGFADSFAHDGDRPAGPQHGSGKLTISTRFEFVTAP